MDSSPNFPHFQFTAYWLRIEARVLARAWASLPEFVRAVLIALTLLPLVWLWLVLVVS